MEDVKETKQDKVYKEFIAWYVQPMEDREKKNLPLTTDEFCKKHKVTKATIGEYLDNPSFFDDIQQNSMSWAKGKTHIIIQAMYKKIMKEMKAEDLREWRQLVYESNKADKEAQNTFIQNNFFQPDERQYQQIVAREAKRISSSSPELPA